MAEAPTTETPVGSNAPSEEWDEARLRASLARIERLQNQVRFSCSSTTRPAHLYAGDRSLLLSLYGAAADVRSFTRSMTFAPQYRRS